ncbi:hypothetical protein ACFL14_00305 [Patescibacteria group bacterium]
MISKNITQKIFLSIIAILFFVLFLPIEINKPYFSTKPDSTTHSAIIINTNISVYAQCDSGTSIKDRITPGDPCWDENGPVISSWRIIRSLINIALVLILLLAAFSNILQINIDTYAVKKVLPAMVLSIILANLSLFICRMFLDASNALSYALVGAEAGGDMGQQVVDHIFNALGLTSIMINGEVSVGEAFKYLQDLGPVDDFGVIALLLLVVVIFVPVVILMLLIWLLFWGRNIALTLLIIASPLAFFALSFPFSQSLFKKWWGFWLTWAFLPVTLLFLIRIASEIGTSNIADSSSFAIWIIGVVLLGFAVIAPFKMGGWMGATLAFAGGFLAARGLDFGKRWGKTRYLEALGSKHEQASRLQERGQKYEQYQKYREQLRNHGLGADALGRAGEYDSLSDTMQHHLETAGISKEDYASYQDLYKQANVKGPDQLRAATRAQKFWSGADPKAWALGASRSARRFRERERMVAGRIEKIHAEESAKESKKRSDDDDAARDLQKAEEAIDLHNKGERTLTPEQLAAHEKTKREVLANYKGKRPTRLSDFKKRMDKTNYEIWSHEEVKYATAEGTIKDLNGINAETKAAYLRGDMTTASGVSLENRIKLDQAAQDIRNENKSMGVEFPDAVEKARAFGVKGLPSAERVASMTREERQALSQEINTKTSGGARLSDRGTTKIKGAPSVIRWGDETNGGVRSEGSRIILDAGIDRDQLDTLKHEIHATTTTNNAVVQSEFQTKFGGSVDVNQHIYEHIDTSQRGRKVDYKKNHGVIIRSIVDEKKARRDHLISEAGTRRLSPVEQAEHDALHTLTDEDIQAATETALTAERYFAMRQAKIADNLIDDEIFEQENITT